MEDVMGSLVTLVTGERNGDGPLDENKICLCFGRRIKYGQTNQNPSHLITSQHNLITIHSYIHFIQKYLRFREISTPKQSSSFHLLDRF
ncbi:hypothetical protein QVD17_36297 [Tagetes erecta]|uniref:Uncharacterized protein n=1 Tax=Tagetes erecta TaxID=13708 RepID=A0AAD8JU37_TARER|nr:hypothetical protein QVD17_36297 [Tagetes erecta]